jgi:cytoskeletal protein RodZ
VAEIGSILREARIRRGLSLKQVSEITKVRVKYLEALEQNDFKVIPGPTFIKAYLRTYASVLRLDPDELVDEYRSTYERRRDSTAEHYDLTLEHVRNRSLRQKKRPLRNTRRGYAVAGALAIVAVVLLAYFGSNRGLPEARMGEVPVGVVTSTTVAGTGGSASTQAGDTTTSSTEAVFTGGVVSLRIRAENTCFVMVRDDSEAGTMLYRKTMQPNEEFINSESKRYWVHIALPEAVRVFINEEEYLVPGEGGAFIVTENQIVPAQ